MSAQGLKFEGPYLPEFLPVDNSKGIKSILKVLENSKIFEKRAFGGYMHPHGTPKVGQYEKSRKTAKKSNFRPKFQKCHLGVSTFSEHFSDFFSKNQ